MRAKYLFSPLALTFLFLLALHGANTTQANNPRSLRNNLLNDENYEIGKRTG